MLKPRVQSQGQGNESKEQFINSITWSTITEHYYLPATVFWGKQGIISALKEFRLYGYRQMRK